MTDNEKHTEVHVGSGKETGTKNCRQLSFAEKQFFSDQN